MWLLSQKNLSIGELAKNEHSCMNEQVQPFRGGPRVHQCRWVKLLLIKWDGDNDTTISFWWWILKVISELLHLNCWRNLSVHDYQCRWDNLLDVLFLYDLISVAWIFFCYISHMWYKDIFYLVIMITVQRNDNCVFV